MGKHDFAELARAANKEPWISNPKLANGLAIGGIVVLLIGMIHVVAGALDYVLGICALIGLICCAIVSHDSGIRHARRWSVRVVTGPSLGVLDRAQFDLSVWELAGFPVACGVSFLAYLVLQSIPLLLLNFAWIGVSAYYFANPFITLMCRRRLDAILAYRADLEGKAYSAVQDLSDLHGLEKLFPNFVLESLVSAQRRATKILHGADGDQIVAQEVLDKIEAFSESEYTQ